MGSGSGSGSASTQHSQWRRRTRKCAWGMQQQRVCVRVCVCATRRIWLMRLPCLPLPAPLPYLSSRFVYLSFASLIQLVTSDYYLRGSFASYPARPLLPAPSSFILQLPVGDTHTHTDTLHNCVCELWNVCLLNNFQLRAHRL